MYTPFEGYQKYLLVRYADDCGTDDGPDFTTKKAAESAARAELREGWETIACINTEAKRIEFVLGKPASVLSWFNQIAADLLKRNTTIPEFMYI